MKDDSQDWACDSFKVADVSGSLSSMRVIRTSAKQSTNPEQAPTLWPLSAPAVYPVPLSRRRYD